MTFQTFSREKLAIKNSRIRQFLGELLGSFILAVVGIGAAHQTSLAVGGQSSTHGAVSGAMGVALGIYSGASASGGHCNPAVTMGFLALGKMGKGFLDNIFGTLIYFCAQFLGMFAAAVVSYAIYYSGEQAEIAKYYLTNGFNQLTDTQAESLICLYCTCPTNDYVNNQGSMFFDQVLGAGILVTTVFACIDPHNANPKGMTPFIVGLSALAVGLSYGANAGGAINSTRDLAPRIFASMLYGEVAYTGIEGTNSFQFMWIPLLGPLVGGFLAAIVYQLCVESHWPVHKKNNIRDSENFDTQSDAL